MSLVGPILLRKQLTDAVAATLTLWMPTYLGEIERQQSVDAGRYLATWNENIVTVPELGKQTEDHLPVITLLAPKVASNKRTQGGIYTMSWQLTVAPIVSAQDEESTDELLDVYAGAVRAILLQKGTLGGFASGTRADGGSESYAGLGLSDARTIQLATLDFLVAVDDTGRSRGPLVPNQTPEVDPGGLQVVTQTDVTVEVNDDD